MINISEVKTEKLESEILEFYPAGCMECGFEGEIPIKYFLVEPEVESQQDYEHLEKTVLKKTGHKSFHEFSGSNLGEIIAVSRCPKCKSEEIFMDV